MGWRKDKKEMRWDEDRMRMGMGWGWDEDGLRTGQSKLQMMLMKHILDLKSGSASNLPTFLPRELPSKS